MSEDTACFDYIYMQAQVIWVDLLTEEEFNAGFGSHTPMFTGQTKCVRYYMNFQRALRLHKEILAEVTPPFPAWGKASIETSNRKTGCKCFSSWQEHARVREGKSLIQEGP